MTFNVGETVVYPNHGAAVIEDLETRTIKGEEKLYLVLRIIGQNDLVVRVPAANLDLVGVRDVVDEKGLKKVFEVLRQPHTEEPANWSRRYKANLEKLHSGNVLKVAEVVRDLWRRERDRGLSAGEKRMLAKARQILSPSSPWPRRSRRSAPSRCSRRYLHPEHLSGEGTRGPADNPLRPLSHVREFPPRPSGSSNQVDRSPAHRRCG